MSYTAESFLAKIKPMVIADMKKSGILASLTAAQAFIESNKGNSGLTEKANNLFGIKGTYNGESVKMLTTEYYNGVAHKVYANFRKYPSWVESIADHSALFNRLARYSNLRGCKDWKLATKYVKDDGYATSPTYTSTLQNTILKYKLYEWDNEVIDEQSKENPYKQPDTQIDFNELDESIRWVQQALINSGYPISVTGIPDAVTQGAILDFQKKHGLKVDGIVGNNTISALLKASKE
jgi:hypothetical protein